MWRNGVRLVLATVAGGALAACGTSGGGSDTSPAPAAESASACEVLETKVPSIAGSFEDVLTGPGGSTAGDVVSWLLLALDDQQSDVRIYLEPGSSEADLSALDDEVRDQPGVIGTRTVDLDQTYADFRRLFEGQQQMLDDVRPEDLPMSVRVEISRADADDLVSWARARPSVYEARDAGDVTPVLLGVAFSQQAARDEWARVADRLDAVAGDPSWATTASAGIETVLAEGSDAAVDDPAALTQARVALDEVFATCDPG